jgi:DNA-binding NtrC family response regulator
VNTDKIARVLIVGGEGRFGATVQNALAQHAYEVDTIESFAGAASALRDRQYDVLMTIQRAPDSAQLHSTEFPRTRDWHLTIEELERAHILNVLANVQGHRGRAAEILGIDRRTLYRKLKDYQRDGANHKDTAKTIEANPAAPRG